MQYPLPLRHTSLPRHDQGRDCFVRYQRGGIADALQAFDRRNLVCRALDGRVWAKQIRYAYGGQEVRQVVRVTTKSLGSGPPKDELYDVAIPDPQSAERAVSDLINATDEGVH